MTTSKKRILSISYDEPLLKTRHLLLEGAGYDVMSAHGYAAAVEIFAVRQSFDLIVMGHSMPSNDKTALLETLRLTCPAPLLSIRRQGDDPLSGAKASVDSLDGPAVLLAAVKIALKD